MTALEIRLAIGAVLALLCGAAGYTLASHHFERVMALQQLAQDRALQDAQARVIAAQKAQKDAETKVELEHEMRTSADAASRNAVLDSMHNLESEVHRRLLPTALAHSGAVQAAQSGAIDPIRLGSLVDRFNASLERFIESCQSVDSDRASIINLEPQGVTP